MSCESSVWSISRLQFGIEDLVGQNNDMHLVDDILTVTDIRIIECYL